MGHNKTVTFDIEIPTTALGSDYDNSKVFPHAGTWLIEYGALMPGVSVAEDATNVIDVSLEISGTEVHSHDTTTTTGDGALTAGTEVDFTSDLTGATKVITQGDRVNAKKTEGGAGKAFGGGYSLSLRRLPI